MKRALGMILALLMMGAMGTAYAAKAAKAADSTTAAPAASTNRVVQGTVVSVTKDAMTVKTMRGDMSILLPATVTAETLTSATLADVKSGSWATVYSIGRGGNVQKVVLSATAPAGDQGKVDGRVATGELTVTGTTVTLKAGAQTVNVTPTSVYTGSVSPLADVKEGDSVMVVATIDRVAKKWSATTVDIVPAQGVAVTKKGAARAQGVSARKKGKAQSQSIDKKSSN
jgi:hypothetical protein